MTPNTLFKPTLQVINVGLKAFGDNVVAAGGQNVTLDWQPPAQGDRAGGWALAELLNHPLVEAANAKALSRFIAANPVLIGVAGNRAPEMKIVGLDLTPSSRYRLGIERGGMGSDVK